MNLSKKVIEYAGILDPSTPQEIKIEILGLRNAIKQAEERISRYEQAIEVAEFFGQLAMEEHDDSTRTTNSETSEEAQKEPYCPPLVR